MSINIHTSEEWGTTSTLVPSARIIQVRLIIKLRLCLHIFVLPSAMMALFAAALNCADPSSYGTYYNRSFYSVVLTLELTKTAKHTILPAGIVLRCATKAAELDESPHVSNALYETTLPCVCVRYHLHTCL